jgi:hypothetical protein
LSIVAIAGEEAAHAPEGVAKRSRRGTRIHEFQDGDFGAPGENEQSSRAAEESSEPSEAVAVEKKGDRMGKEFRRRFERTVDL